ncbi:HTH_Tnp_Tc3_2 domain-containing protein [Trichonephila clavipes]|nr:HTH_Tnp_Tc3_2 domain-containing protein [Trichonephila clavipes]
MWLNASPSLIHRLLQKFLTTDSASRSLSQGRPCATTSADDRYSSLCIPRNKTATPAELIFSLAASSGSHLRHAISGSICEHVNMSTGRVIKRGLFYLRRSPALVSKAMVGLFSFKEKLKLVFIHDTSMKEMHTDQVVSVFRMVSVWVDLQTSMSFFMEMLMLTPIEITSWMLMFTLEPGQ